VRRQSVVESVNFPVRAPAKVEIHGRTLTEHCKEEIRRPVWEWHGVEGIDVWVYGHKMRPAGGGEDERGCHCRGSVDDVQDPRAIVEEGRRKMGGIYSKRVITWEY
jgi:hypothetical protein